MSDEALRTLLRSVVIHSPMEYELAGRIHKVAPFGAGQSSMWTSWSSGEPPLVVDLTTRIYEEAYCRPLGTLREPPQTTTSLIEELSAANAGRDRWESGWTLVQLMPNGHASARKGDLANTFAPGEFAAASAGALSPGAAVHV